MTGLLIILISSIVWTGCLASYQASVVRTIIVTNSSYFSIPEKADHKVLGALRLRSLGLFFLFWVSSNDFPSEFFGKTDDRIVENSVGLILFCICYFFLFFGKQTFFSAFIIFDSRILIPRSSPYLEFSQAL